MLKNILDIGCGTGFRTSRIGLKKNVKVTGIDLSERNIVLARKRHRYPNISFQRMTAEDLNFPSSSFDEVVATDVLEHVDNLDKVLREIQRVLKPGGKLTVVVPGERSERWLLKLRPTYFDEIHHVRIFKSDFLERKLELQFKMKLTVKKSKGFLQHLELLYFFKTSKKSVSQLEIGGWRNNFLSFVVHTIVSLFDPYWVFHTPLKYFPLWIITLPMGLIINYFGNQIMPKSIYYEFVKTK